MEESALLTFLAGARLDLTQFEQTAFLKDMIRFSIYPCPLEYGAVCLDYKPKNNLPRIFQSCLTCIHYNNVPTVGCNAKHDFQTYYRLCEQYQTEGKS